MQKLFKSHAGLSHIAYYAMAIFVTKMLALLAVPMVTGHITPAEFGKLELIVSVIECAGLVSGLAIAEVFNRVGADKQKLAALGGATLVLSSLIIMSLQGFAFIFSNETGFTHPNWLHASLLSAGLGAMIDLPLSQIRAQNHSRFFALTLIARTSAQFLLQYIFLNQGLGVGAILYANMCVEVVVSVMLMIWFYKSTSITFSREAYKTIFTLSLPYLIGGLAMYMVGNADRWFLVKYVSLEEIAFYGIAMKFALFVALFSHAFHMWWGGRKYAIYDSENGDVKTQKIMLMGFAMNLTGGAIVYLFSPLFIHYILPPSYQAVVTYIPMLIIVSLMNETATLFSLGAYRAKTGMPVLMINVSGAFVAFVFYILLIPIFGIYGAIYATIFAHFLRIMFYFRECQKVTPLPIFHNIRVKLRRQRIFAFK